MRCALLIAVVLLAGCDGPAERPAPQPLPEPAAPAPEPAAPAPLAAFPDIAFPPPPWTLAPAQPGDRVALAGLRLLDATFTGGDASVLQAVAAAQAAHGWRALPGDGLSLAKGHEVLRISASAGSIRLRLEPLP